MGWLRDPLGSGIVMMTVIKMEVVELGLVENSNKSRNMSWLCKKDYK